MWRFIQDLARTEAEVELRPKELLADFEDGPLNAFQMVFERAEVRGCRFHLHQNFVEARLGKTYKRARSYLPSWSKSFL